MATASSTQSQPQLDIKLYVTNYHDHVISAYMMLDNLDPLTHIDGSTTSDDK